MSDDATDEAAKAAAGAPERAPGDAPEAPPEVVLPEQKAEVIDPDDAAELERKMSAKLLKAEAKRVQKARQAKFDKMCRAAYLAAVGKAFPAKLKDAGLLELREFNRIAAELRAAEKAAPDRVVIDVPVLDEPPADVPPTDEKPADEPTTPAPARDDDEFEIPADQEPTTRIPTVPAIGSPSGEDLAATVSALVEHAVSRRVGGLKTTHFGHVPEGKTAQQLIDEARAGWK